MTVTPAKPRLSPGIRLSQHGDTKVLSRGGIMPGASAHIAGTDAASAPAAGIARRSSALWDSTAPHDRGFDVLGMTFTNVPLREASADLVEEARSGRRTRAVFVNAHVMNCAWADTAYWQTVASAHRRFADGSGLAIAARMAGKAFVDNVNGTDMLPVLCDQALRAGKTVYLLGGVPEAAAGSAATLAKLGYGAAIAGAHHGHFTKGGAEEQAVIAAINESGAAIVLVGLGVPLQDQWIEVNAGRFNAPVLVGVGGLFDFYSGRASRAPQLLRTLGLEWTWRLAREPSRMWKRYIIGNVTFLARSALWSWRAGKAVDRRPEQAA